MVRKDSRMSTLEWEIMNVIWDLGGSPSVRDVLEYKYPEGQKAYTTVQTVMNNIVQKGYLKKKKVGMVNFYTPTRERGATLKKETSFIASKVFGGSVPAMASFLLKSSKLSLEEIDDLKKLIDEKEKKLKGKK